MIKNTPILITGCQRSGTTLLSLILNSHPHIKKMDEGDFFLELLNEYLTHPDYHPYIAFKLPKISHLVPALQFVPGIKILWCIRDPRDVVTSMLRLKRRVKGRLKGRMLWSKKHPKEAIMALLKFQPLPLSVSWISYSHGALHEIHLSAKTLKRRKVLTQELTSYLNRYREIKKKHPLRFTHEEEIFLGALCWRLKQEVLNSCDLDESLYQVVQYEKLIRNPEQEIRTMLQFLNIPWHDNVMEHHALHSGIFIGETDGKRPIDGSNLNKWKDVLSDHDVKTIGKICADAAMGMYRFNSL
jgi:hypothetical protein